MVLYIDSPFRYGSKFYGFQTIPQILINFSLSWFWKRSQKLRTQTKKLRTFVHPILTARFELQLVHSPILTPWFDADGKDQDAVREVCESRVVRLLSWGLGRYSHVSHVIMIFFDYNGMYNQLDMIYGCVWKWAKFTVFFFEIYMTNLWI
jgi:hypothetical protein